MAVDAPPLVASAPPSEARSSGGGPSDVGNATGATATASTTTARRSLYAYDETDQTIRARGVELSDRELLRRVRRVQVTAEFTEQDDEFVATRGRRPNTRRGWAFERELGGVAVFSRALDAGRHTRAVVATGEVRCSPQELASVLRSPSESDYNALLRGLCGRRFIYGSLVHLVSNSDRRSLLATADANAQLAVRSASFVHSPLASLLLPSRALKKKNDQVCYAEYFVPTPDGFVVRYCSLPAAELRVGTAPADHVQELHPFTGWLIAKRVNRGPDQPMQSVRLTFRATYHAQPNGSNNDSSGYCSLRRARQWMDRVVRAVARIGELVQRRRGGLAADQGLRDARSPHRNWHCIACTQSLVHLYKRRGRRCDLCAYNVCAESCCSLDHVAFYNRYVAPLLVCARCQDCIDGKEVAHQIRGVTGRIASDLERWDTSPTPRLARSRNGQHRRRAQSDPPFVPTLELTSSGDERSSRS